MISDCRSARRGWWIFLRERGRHGRYALGPLLGDARSLAATARFRVEVRWNLRFEAVYSWPQ